MGRVWHYLIILDAANWNKPSPLSKNCGLWEKAQMWTIRGAKAMGESPAISSGQKKAHRFIASALPFGFQQGGREGSKLHELGSIYQIFPSLTTKHRQLSVE
jgi:hypothetical protein